MKGGHIVKSKKSTKSLHPNMYAYFWGVSREDYPLYSLMEVSIFSQWSLPFLLLPYCDVGIQFCVSAAWLTTWPPKTPKQNRNRVKNNNKTQTTTSCQYCASTKSFREKQNNKNERKKCIILTIWYRRILAVPSIVGLLIVRNDKLKLPGQPGGSLNIL